MIQISKQQFLEMFSLGILNGSRKDLKEWTVVCKQKKSRRKKYYIHEAHYQKYKQIKNKQKDNTT